ERLSKEGELGRRKITQYTRYLTLVLAVVQALGIAVFLERQTQIAGGLPLVYNPGWGFRLMCVLTLTTGTAFIMWLGEQITERGIGNGMSLLIFAGIVVGFPRAVLTTFDQMQTGQISLIRVLFLLVMMFLVRITLVGALYLAMVAILPEFLITGFKVAPIPFIGEQLDAMLPRWITEGLGVTFYFGGTSLLIVVGVAMDTVQQVESQLIMRHYDGFMKKTRIRGRRG